MTRARWPTPPRPEEVLFLAVRRESLPGAFAELEPRLAQLRLAREVITARLEAPPNSPFDGDLAEVSETLAELYGPDHIWSPSRLEDIFPLRTQLFCT